MKHFKLIRPYVKIVDGKEVFVKDTVGYRHVIEHEIMAEFSAENLEEAVKKANDIAGCDIFNGYRNTDTYILQNTETGNHVCKSICSNCRWEENASKAYVYIDDIVTKLCPVCGHIIKPCIFCREHKLKKDDAKCHFYPDRCTADVKCGLTKEEIKKYNKMRSE